MMVAWLPPGVMTQPRIACSCTGRTASPHVRSSKAQREAQRAVAEAQRHARQCRGRSAAEVQQALRQARHEVHQALHQAASGGPTSPWRRLDELSNGEVEASTRLPIVPSNPQPRRGASPASPAWPLLMRNRLAHRSRRAVMAPPRTPGSPPVHSTKAENLHTVVGLVSATEERAQDEARKQARRRGCRLARAAWACLGRGTRRRGW